MITNKWMNRAALLVLMFMLYGIGIAAGRDQAVAEQRNMPVCHLNLKP